MNINNKNKHLTAVEQFIQEESLPVFNDTVAWDLLTARICLYKKTQEIIQAILSKKGSKKNLYAQISNCFHEYQAVEYRYIAYVQKYHSFNQRLMNCCKPDTIRDLYSALPEYARLKWDAVPELVAWRAMYC